jgi:hypothetical protein
MTKYDELQTELAVAKSAAMFQILALVGALAERHAIDPVKAADWAEFFANEMEHSARDSAVNQDPLQKVAAQLHDYATQLLHIVKSPENPE